MDNNFQIYASFGYDGYKDVHCKNSPERIGGKIEVGYDKNKKITFIRSINREDGCFYLLEGHRDQWGCWNYVGNPSAGELPCFCVAQEDSTRSFILAYIEALKVFRACTEIDTYHPKIIKEFDWEDNCLHFNGKVYIIGRHE